MDSISLKGISKKRWLGWIFLIVFFVLQFTLQGIISIFVDGIRMSMSLDANSISLLSSSFFYPYMLMQVPVGFLFDRYGIRKIMISAIILVSISCLFFSFAKSLAAAVLCRIVMGFGCSFGFVGVFSATNRWFPARYFIFLITTVESLAMICTAGANALLSRVVSMYDWRAASLLLGGAAIFCTLGVHLFVKGEETQAPSQTLLHALRYSLAKILKSKEVWLGGLFSLFLFAIVGAFAGLWAVPYIMTYFGLDLVPTASAVAMIYVGVAVISPMMGWLSRLLSCTSLMLIGAVGSLVTLIWLFYGPKLGLSGLYILFFILGVFCSVYQLPFVIVNKAVARDVQGAATGMTNMLTMLSVPIFQGLIGLILVSSGSTTSELAVYSVTAFHRALSVLPLGLGLALLIVWGLQEKRHSLKTG